MPYVIIDPSQTIAGAPVNQTLMDDIRNDLDVLDALGKSMTLYNDSEAIDDAVGISVYAAAGPVDVPVNGKNTAVTINVPANIAYVGVQARVKITRGFSGAYWRMRMSLDGTTFGSWMDVAAGFATVDFGTLAVTAGLHALKIQAGTDGDGVAAFLSWLIAQGG